LNPRARLPLAGTPNAPPRTLYSAPKPGRRAPRGLVSQFFLLVVNDVDLYSFILGESSVV
jgi:hypothetical protein